MSSQPLHPRKSSIRIPFIFISALLLLILITSNGYAAQNALPPKDTYYYIQISSPKTPVCVGESRVITVSWDTEPFSDLANLVPGPPLPITGPRILYAQTPRVGEMDKNTTHPSGPVGTTTFTYTAHQNGPEVLIFQAMDNNLKVVGQNEITFEVKKCDYRFELFGQLDVDASSADAQFTFNYLFRAKGLLKEDPNKVRNYRANSVQIAVETNIITFSAPKCTLFTWKPGTGEGTVDVLGEQPGNGNMNVRFSPPKDLAWKYDVRAECDGKPFALNVQFPETGSNDPWVQASFPNSEGLQSVKIDYFDAGVNNFKNAGIPASYTAFVIITRVEPK